MTDYGFIRVSSGSQDAATQRRDILKVSPRAIIVSTATKAASASKGEQLDALDGILARLHKGDRVIVTDSSRLDRRDNLTSQVETMLDIRRRGATIVSLKPGEETFANGDDLGSWVTTIVTQHANAAKSTTTKEQTQRGIREVAANNATYGPLPIYWSTTGERYRRQAYCVAPDKVTDMYRRVADGESMAAVARDYGTNPQSIRKLLRWEPNHTGIQHCRRNGLEWTHRVVPVVSSDLWWRANKILAANKASDRINRGGRPIRDATHWISGILDCPVCGGHLYLNNPQNTKLRCGGSNPERLACRKFTPVPVEVVQRELDAWFADDDTPLLAYERVSGNAHELDTLNASCAALRASLSAIEDRKERRRAIRRLEALEDEIEAFTVVPDTYAYTPTGQTVGQLYRSSDMERRHVVQAFKNAIGIIVHQDGTLSHDEHAAALGMDDDGIVKLSDKLCFRPMPVE